MAKKFIDADILFKNIIDHHYLITSSSNSTDYGMFTTGIKQAIDEIPVADVIEVVRCKDCEYRKTEDCAMQYECECGAQYYWESDNAFCSRGRQKDSSDNV